MEPFHCTCVDTISSIKKEDWDLFFADCPEGYWFYETLEQSRLEEFSFHYLLARRGQRLCAIIPFFTADFHADTVLEPGMRQLVRAVRAAIPRFLVFKTLFCGSPFGEQGLLGIAPDEAAGTSELLRAVARELAAFSRRQGLALIIFKDYCQQEAPALKGLAGQGFFKTDSFPSAIIDLPYKTFDEYLASLSSGARKDLRRKLKKARDKGGLTTKVVECVDDMIDDIYRLYMNTYTAGATKFEKLTKEFFLICAEKAGYRCRYFLYYIDGKLAAFNLCFVHGDLLIDKFIGFDYSIARQYSLYFVSWCENVKWCIDNGIRRYQVGQTDYEPKTHLGCRLVPLFAYVRHTSALVNRCLQVLTRFLNF
jgi:predicted N-acyltransferase